MVIRPVGLGVKFPCGAEDQILVAIGQLRVCCCVASSLRSGRSVVYSCYSLSHVLSFSDRCPAGSMSIFHSLRFDSPPFLEGQKKHSAINTSINLKFLQNV